MSKTNSPADITAAQPQVPFCSEPVTLDTPVRRGEQVIDKVAVRKPVSGELRGAALADLLKLDVAALQLVLPRITVPSLLPHEVHQLELPDLVALGTELVGFFLPKSERAALFRAG